MCICGNVCVWLVSVMVVFCINHCDFFYVRVCVLCVCVVCYVCVCVCVGPSQFSLKDESGKPYRDDES